MAQDVLRWIYQLIEIVQINPFRWKLYYQNIWYIIPGQFWHSLLKTASGISVWLLSHSATSTGKHILIWPCDSKFNMEYLQFRYLSEKITICIHFLFIRSSLNRQNMMRNYLKQCSSNFNMLINTYWSSYTDPDSIDLEWALRFYINNNSQMTTMLLTDGVGRPWRIFPSSSRCPKIYLWFKLNLQTTEH